MPVRIRSGKWHYRFVVNDHEYTGSTDLVGTERNRTAAMRSEAEARKLVLSGRGSELRLEVQPFSKAAEDYLAWAEGEYREHPNTARRLRTSFASLKVCFGNRTVSSISAGQIEDYKGARRRAEVREVTLRHDLHALSGFFGYAIKHNWARENPVRNVEIPSDKDAVRIHVLTAEEERLYFATCREGWKTEDKRKRTVEHGPFMDLHDLGRLMLNQGCRPEELLSLPWSAVDFVAGVLRIAHSKSTAGRRTLRLTPESRAILEARRAIQPGEKRWVFSSPTKPGCHVVNLHNSHELVRQHTGLAFVIYDWRHTFATRAAQSGMDLATLAKILGHSNLRSVMKYVHPSQEHMNEAMDRFAAAQQPVIETTEVQCATIN